MEFKPAAQILIEDVIHKNPKALEDVITACHYQPLSIKGGRLALTFILVQLMCPSWLDKTGMRPPCRAILP